MKKSITKFFKNMLYDTIIYIILFILIGFILNQLGYTYLRWFIYINMFIILVGIITGTIQTISKREKKSKLIIKAMAVTIELFILLSIDLGYILFQDYEEIVYKDNKKMVKETHSFLTSNWINYYDYKNIFIRRKQVRIHESHNNYIGDYMGTIYYDGKGNIVP